MGNSACGALCGNLGDPSLAALGLHRSAQDSSSRSVQAPHRGGFSRHGAPAPGAQAAAVPTHRLSLPRACGSWTRDGSHVPCIGRQVPIHGSARRPGANSLPRAPLQILLLLLTPGRVGGPALAALCSHSVPSRKLECWPQTLAVMENTSGNILVRMFGYTHIHVSAEVEHAMFASRR